jgi:hypothetical protein
LLRPAALTTETVPIFPLVLHRGGETVKIPSSVSNGYELTNVTVNIFEVAVLSVTVVDTYNKPIPCKAAVIVVDERLDIVRVATLCAPIPISILPVIPPVEHVSFIVWTSWPEPFTTSVTLTTAALFREVVDNEVRVVSPTELLKVTIQSLVQDVDEGPKVTD